jgi:uncharacterized membrane protein (DUF4010 family)
MLENANRRGELPLELEAMEIFRRLATALAVGLLIGLERGWTTRGLGEGHRTAGLRTFGLLGLLGALGAVLSIEYGETVLLTTLIGAAAIIVAGYVQGSRLSGDVGITTAVAGLVTVGIGMIAGRGGLLVASATGVVVVAVLSAKPITHAWIERLDREELVAAVKLLLISVVLLPVLPDVGYGPWEALNPYRIWWMVVVITGVSFVGYVLTRVLGPGRGIVTTGLTGGLVASTAVTLGFARMAKDRAFSVHLLAAGTLGACATMFPRLILVTALIMPALAQALAPALVAAGLTGYLIAGLFWRRAATVVETPEANVVNPFEIGVAIRFGLLLVVIMLAGKGLESEVGDTGLMLLAAASGITDVDAIALTLAELAQDSVRLNLAATGVLVAASVNSVVKAGMAWVIGGVDFGRQATLGLVLSIGAAWLAWGSTLPVG